ncbi:hypothetical protein F5Y06DRAFT_300540 [Hypoxylon sp. FL0890]|nr:hypothetical protein F5Y06DRAFT_300540 [Hypoxylon sp. FL0890]
MCSAVQFIYRCGCVESTTFECSGTTINITHHRRRRCYGAYKVISTVLDEDCHDCSGGAESPSLIPVGVLRERSPNMPTPRPPTPVMGEDLAIGMGLLESEGDFE